MQLSIIIIRSKQWRKSEATATAPNGKHSRFLIPSSHQGEAAGLSVSVQCKSYLVLSNYTGNF